MMDKSFFIAASFLIWMCLIFLLAWYGLKSLIRQSKFFREKRLARKLARFEPQHNNDKLMVDSPVGKEFGSKS